MNRVTPIHNAHEVWGPKGTNRSFNWSSCITRQTRAGIEILLRVQKYSEVHMVPPTLRFYIVHSLHISVLTKKDPSVTPASQVRIQCRTHWEVDHLSLNLDLRQNQLLCIFIWHSWPLTKKENTINLSSNWITAPHSSCCQACCVIFKGMQYVIPSGFSRHKQGS